MKPFCRVLLYGLFMAGHSCTENVQSPVQTQADTPKLSWGRLESAAQLLVDPLEALRWFLEEPHLSRAPNGKPCLRNLMGLKRKTEPQGFSCPVFLFILLEI